MCMKYKELKNKNVKELDELLNETRDELRQLSFKAGENQLKNVRKIRIAKKTIAQILTACTAHARV